MSDSCRTWRRRAKLARCRALLAALPTELPPVPKTVAGVMRRLTGVDLTRCPVCLRGRLPVVAVFEPGAHPVLAPDTS